MNYYFNRRHARFTLRKTMKTPTKKTPTKKRNPEDSRKKAHAVAFWLSDAEVARMNAKAKKRAGGNRTKLLRSWIAA